MEPLKLFMFLLGCKPEGRHTEQHDVFFAAGTSVKELVPAIRAFWPEGGEGIHIDGWREITGVNGHRVTVIPAAALQSADPVNGNRLFFLNLGGYKAGEFEEFHYKVLSVASDKNNATKEAKNTAFFKYLQQSHVDDKYGVDVDDIYDVEDILPQSHREQYRIVLSESGDILPEDEIHLGYFKLNKF